MTKIRTHKGYIIAMGSSMNCSYALSYFVFTKDNWESEIVTRYSGHAEWEAETLAGCIEWIG